jgi:hypothetical protein
VIDPLRNTNLIVRKGVVLTPTISKVITRADEFFRKASIKSYVTSGLRDPASQMRIILDAGWARGLQKEWPQLQGATGETTVIHAGQSTPLWYVVWGRLLTIGFMVNPPIESKTPFGYVHPSGRRIPEGTVIQPSAHFKGIAFDVGGSGGSVATIDDELACLEAAKSAKIGIVRILAERENNAVHVDCEEAA